VVVRPLTASPGSGTTSRRWRRAVGHRHPGGGWVAL